MTARQGLFPSKQQPWNGLSHSYGFADHSADLAQPIGLLILREPLPQACPCRQGMHLWAYESRIVDATPLQLDVPRRIALAQLRSG